MVSMGMVHTLLVSTAFAAVLVDAAIFSTRHAGMATLRIWIQIAESKTFLTTARCTAKVRNSRGRHRQYDVVEARTLVGRKMLGRKISTNAEVCWQNSFNGNTVQ